jgi:hypothetical protein
MEQSVALLIRTAKQFKRIDEGSPVRFIEIGALAACM